MNIKTLCIISGVCLLLAIPTGWPYDFYILLRWFIFGISAYVANGFYKSNLPSWALIFGGISLLFNPIFPFYLSKSSWVLIDFVSSIVFFLSVYSFKVNNKLEPDIQPTPDRPFDEKTLDKDFETPDSPINTPMIQENSFVGNNLSKQQLRQMILENTKSLLDLTGKNDQLKSELFLIKQEYTIRIGRLYLKLDEIDLKILRQIKVNELLKAGNTIEEALKIVNQETKDKEETIKSEHKKIDEEEYIENNRKELTADEENELKTLWRDLVKKFHPDLAFNVEDRKEREEKMKVINEAYHDKDIQKLRSISKEKSIEENEDVSLDVLQERLFDITQSIENLQEEYAELRKSEWYKWDVNIKTAKKKGRDLFKELETKILQNIAEKEKELILLKKHEAKK